MFNASVAHSKAQINLVKKIIREKKHQRAMICEGINLKVGNGKNYMELWCDVFHEDVLDEFRSLGYKIEVEIRPNSIINRITKFYW